MPVGEICNREVVVAERTTTIVEAARLMRRYHVGDLVVVDEVQGRRVPVGMVTDRDLVVEVIAREQPFASCTVSAVMSATVVCVPETAGVIEAIQLMRSHGVRRVPVVDAGGALVGASWPPTTCSTCSPRNCRRSPASPRAVRSARCAPACPDTAGGGQGRGAPAGPRKLRCARRSVG